MRFLTVPAGRAASIGRNQADAAAPRLQVASPPAADATPNPLADRFRALGLHGMARTLSQLGADPSEIAAPLSNWLALLAESEAAEQKQRRIASRLRSAHLRYQAPMTDVDYNAVRGFDDGLFHWLALGQWIVDRENVIIDGPTGVGKTWLACALGEKACRDEHTVLYARVPELLDELGAKRHSARYARRMRAVKCCELLILDDWGLEPFGAVQRQEMLGIIEHRYGRGSTLVAGPVPAEGWPETIGDPAVAAMILDRIVPNAHRLQLSGESLRARHASTQSGDE